MPPEASTKTIREIVITMLGNHESMDLIHRYTAMPLEEIEQIGREQQEKGVRKDTFFKTVFQNKTMFRMFIRDFVDAQWTQAVQEENLELLPSLYPQIIESTRENDVVYRLKMGEEEMVIIIMLENQSSVDFLMPFRILEYMTRIWRRHIQDHPKESQTKDFRLPAIVPILFYDGGGEWTAPVSFQEKVDHQKTFEDFVPKFEHLLINLTPWTVEMLAQFKDLAGLVMILDKARTPEELAKIQQLKEDFWECVMEQLAEYGMTGLMTDIIYALMTRKGADKEQTLKVIEKVRKGEVKQGMFAYSEELDIRVARKRGFEEGKLEGKLEGERKGRSEGKLEGERKGRSEGKLEGKLEGERKGRLEGKLEGERQAKIEIAQNYIQRKFDNSPPEYLKAIEQMTLDQIEALWNDLMEIQNKEALDEWFQRYLSQT